jgi:hypothetical protein
MERNLHTTDLEGFDYMANSGREEKDRDTFGMWMAIVIVAVLTIFQYLGWY